ncbi:MAG: MotA/TolQ/ExbB proton channel family protein [Elusimicrobia bacterium]|nr:MotA/TolQ/ExbB proton channel family protein [Elusimicrobiota bacterium]
MDFMTITGLLVGGLAVYYALAVGGIGDLIFNLPAAVLVFGGTLGATMVTYPWSIFSRVPKAVGLMLFPPKRLSPEHYITLLVQLSERAKKSGIDSLQDDIPKIQDPFLVDGLQMLLDGLDANMVRENLDKEIVFLRRRHSQLTSVFRSMGTYAPIFGLLGTLIGVVQVLQNLTDPTSIGAAMAVAVVTTFYGIFSTNFFYLPTAGKLDSLTEQEVLLKEVAIEGILSIQKGDIPMIVSRKLHAYLAYKIRQFHRKKGTK